MKPFRASILRELRQLKAHPRYLILMSLVWVFCYLFFISLMYEGTPEKLPIAIVDHDGSYLSRRLCHEINATQGVSVVAVYNNHREARMAMQRQDIYAFYEIPKNIYSDVLAFKAPHVALYANNAYLLAGSFSYKTLATIGKLAAAAVQREVLRKKGMSEKELMGVIQPIEMDTHMISNPTANYQPYVLTTLLPGVLGVLALLFTVYIVAGERKNNTMKEWLNTANGDMVCAVVAKLLPYTLWFSLLGIVGNIILFKYLHYTLEGSLLMLSVMIVVFVLAQQALATFIAGVIPEMHLSICVAAIYGMLSFTMSGFSYPVTNMVPFMQGFSYLFPLRNYYLSYVDIAIFGNGVYQYWPYLCLLLIFVLLGFVGAFLLYREAKRDNHSSDLETAIG